MILKCVFILIMVRFLSLFETKHETHCAESVQKLCDTESCLQKRTVLLSFSFLNVPFQSVLQLFLIFFGTGSEVLKLLKIRNEVWFKTPCSLVYGYECSGGAFWVLLHRKDRGRMSRLKSRYPPVRLHGPITRNTTFESFPWTISLFITNQR
jgi:hypothetical protein